MITKIQVLDIGQRLDHEAGTSPSGWSLGILSERKRKGEQSNDREGAKQGVSTLGKEAMGKYQDCKASVTKLASCWSHTQA